MSIIKTSTFMSKYYGLTDMFMLLWPPVELIKIYTQESTEKYSAIPYMTTFIDYILNAWKNHPQMTREEKYDEYLIYIGGAAVQALYMLIFFWFTPKRKKRDFLGLLWCVFETICIVVFLSAYSYDTSSAQVWRNFCGMAASLSSILSYSSPLLVTIIKIRAQRTEHMPNSLSWFISSVTTARLIYGHSQADIFDFVANLCGVLFGLIQFMLYYYYHAKKGNNLKTKYERNQAMTRNHPSKRSRT